ncbi:MAG: hypothetical protein ABJN42_19920 [Roseibium sp.]|uniref:hypothetical protein n=1 Tax=Roseibium sp. TaxID=1936156 RepID=UPI0032981545
MNALAPPPFPLGLDWQDPLITRHFDGMPELHDQDHPATRRMADICARRAFGRYALWRLDEGDLRALGLKGAQLGISPYYGGTVRGVTTIEAENGVIFSTSEQVPDLAFASLVFGAQKIRDLIENPPTLPFTDPQDPIEGLPNDARLSNRILSIKLAVQQQMDANRNWQTGCFVDPENPDTIIPQVIEASRSDDLPRRRLYAHQAAEYGQIVRHIFETAETPKTDSYRQVNINACRQTRQAILEGAPLIDALCSHYAASRKVIRAARNFGECVHGILLDAGCLAHLEKLPPEHLPKSPEDFSVARSMAQSGMDVSSARGNWKGAEKRLQDLQDFVSVQESISREITRRCKIIFGKEHAMGVFGLIMDDFIPNTLAGRERMSRRWHAVAAPMEMEKMLRIDPDNEIKWRPLTTPFRSGGKEVREVCSMKEMALLGMDQDHCIGGYTSEVFNRMCIIVTVRDATGVTSTAELGFELESLEHKARHNAKPSVEDEALLAEFAAARRPSETQLQTYFSDLEAPEQIFHDKSRAGLSTRDLDAIFEKYLSDCMPRNLGIRSVQDMDRYILLITENRFKIYQPQEAEEPTPFSC